MAGGPGHLCHNFVDHLGRICQGAEPGCYAALVGRGMRRGSAMGCVGAEEEAVGKLLRPVTRCAVPECRGISHADATFREALWDRFFTAAPRPRTPSELLYSDRRL